MELILIKSAILKYNVCEKDVGKTVEIICKKEFQMSSKLLTKLKLDGKIYINGNVARSVDKVNINDIVIADVYEEDKSENIVPKNIELDIVYEDEFVLIVNKPRNMSIHPSIGNFDNTLANGVINHYIKNGEIHKFHSVNRIDKDTSGICVIAKNQFSHGVLSNQMKEKKFKRKYMAIVKGTLEDKEGIIDLPIARDENSAIKRIVNENGKNAVTCYKVLKEKNGLSLLDIHLKTGRTHQIRVHFSHIGNPLLNDWLYDDEVKDGQHLLHSYYVEFYHPKTKEYLKFNIPLPDDMRIL